MNRVRVTKIKVEHNKVRTDEIIGTVFIEPQIGKQLVMISEPLDETKDYRHFNTSVIEDIDFGPGGELLLTTRSGSVYSYEVLSD
jgi:hypothetical protein